MKYHQNLLATTEAKHGGNNNLGRVISSEWNRDDLYKLQDAFHEYMAAYNNKYHVCKHMRTHMKQI